MTVINLDNTGSVQVSGSVLHLAGTIINDGIISIDQGSVSNYGSPYGFDFNQPTGGTLDFSLGSSASSTFFNGGTGTFLLAGSLTIGLDNGFQPAPGEEWTLLSGSSISDTFQTYDFSPLPNGLAFAISYLPNSTILSVVEVPEPGLALAIVPLICGFLARRRNTVQKPPN